MITRAGSFVGFWRVNTRQRHLRDDLARFRPFNSQAAARVVVSVVPPHRSLVQPADNIIVGSAPGVPSE